MRQSCTSTTWLWNLHADAHDFRSSPDRWEPAPYHLRAFASHFGHLSFLFVWLSGMYFSGARFSNYEAWLHDPIHVRPSSQVAWPGLNQDVLNGDQGGGFSAIRITSGFFHLWRGAGILSEAQLFDTAIGSLLLAWLMLGAGWFHYHRSVPTLAWFNDADSMLNHHLGGLLGLGSLGWAGHLVHVACPVNNCLDLGLDPLVTPPPPRFSGFNLLNVFALNWSDLTLLSFFGGLNPTGSCLWFTDNAHHHLAIGVVFLVAGQFINS
jgi:photosystem I P700 chlorophyll a apoprotein A1